MRFVGGRRRGKRRYVRVYALIFPTPKTPSVGGVLRGDGGIDFLFRPGGRFTFPTEKKKEKSFLVFRIFVKFIFSVIFLRIKYRFPHMALRILETAKPCKEKLNYGPSFCTMPQKKGMCV